MKISPFAFAFLLFTVAGAEVRAEEGPETFRVMAYNIHHGRGLDNVVDLERIAGVIAGEKADIVGLQEVDRGVRRTERSDQPAELARLTGMEVYFEKNHPHQGGEYGNALLSRFPLRDARNTHLPRVGTTEQRGVQQAVVEVHGKDILFLNTHIANGRPGREERLASVVEFARILEENEKGDNLPVIFVGDFNDTPGTEVYRRMAGLMDDTWPMAGEGDGATIPVREPRRRIDYIWISKEAPFVPVKAWIPYTEASDHLPVVVEFRMRD